MTGIEEVSDQFKAIAELFGIKKMVGFEDAVTAECEQKIGRLPAVLRDYYLELGGARTA
jgi:hypothetical protein